MKAEITEEFRQLCLGVVNGTIDVVEEDDHLIGEYTTSELNDIVLNGYPWNDIMTIAKSVLDNGIYLQGHLEGDFYWIHAKTNGTPMSMESSIGCTLSLDCGKWSPQNYFKFPARVALESLRARLDRGV